MRTSRFVVAITLGCVSTFGADWLTDGGSPQRTGWQKDEKILNKDNVKNLKIVWKLQLDNKPIEMHSLFPPLIVDKVNTSSGPKQIAIVAGVSDNIYAIDVATAKIIWKKHFEYPASGAERAPGGSSLPGGSHRDTRYRARERERQQNCLYALAGDGQLHSLNVADGEDVAPAVPVRLSARQILCAKPMWNDVLFTTTAQGCAGNPNQMWSVKSAGSDAQGDDL